MKRSTSIVRQRVDLLPLLALIAVPLVSSAPVPAQKAAMPIPGPIGQPVRIAVQPVPGFVTRAARLGALEPKQHISVIVSLNFPQPQLVEAYADAVSDPKSPLYRRFLTPAEIAQRFGPSVANYQAVVNHLTANGLKITWQPVNRMTVHATGTTTQIEAAFGTKLATFRESAKDRVARKVRNAAPLTFFAYETPPSVPAVIAPLVQGIAGLENYTRPIPRLMKKMDSPLSPDAVRTAYNTAPLYDGLQMRGQGRTVGIMSFEWTVFDDTTAFISQFSLPTPQGGPGTNVRLRDVNGGTYSTDGYSGEANLDVQMVLGMAPLANVVIYDCEAQNGYGDYYACLAAAVSDNTADIITESWGWWLSNYYCQQLHNQHLMMTTQGITYVNASGDNGTDLTYDYPEIDPDVLVVGGTVMALDSQNHIVSETGWHGSGGGYDQTVRFKLPAYQKGRGVNTSVSFRQFPDVALHSASAADDSSYLFFQDGSELTGIGTSFASPTFAGALALVEQYLVSKNVLTPDSNGHTRLGRINDAIYAMNGRNDVFHDITSGQNDWSNDVPNGYLCTRYWDYVTGWGSVDFNNLAAALAAPLTVSANAPTTQVTAGNTLNLTSTVTGSNVQTVTWSIFSGPGSISSSGVYTAPGPDAITAPTSVTIRDYTTIDAGTPTYGTATLTILPTALSTVALNPASTRYTSQGTATLTGPAGSKGVTVTLSSSNTAAATVPSSVLVASGSTSATFTITAKAVYKATPVTISATYNGVTRTAVLTVLPRSASGSPGPVGPPIGGVLPHAPGQ